MYIQYIQGLRQSMFSTAGYALFLVASATTTLTIPSTLSLIKSRHGARSTENTPLYCCRGVLPRSCLANSLGTDHIENTFHSCRLLL
jgi:hypothetical protein